MKHDIQIVASLFALFFATQVIGLALLNLDIRVQTTPEGVREVVHSETVVGPRPEVSGSESFVLVILSVLIGTGLLLLLIRIGKVGWWRILFFLAVFLTISISLGIVLQPEIALLLALAITALKLFRPHVIIHNLSEILIYSGLVILFAPLFELLWIALLLVAISAYDMFAVWKSGHMVTMARSLSEKKIFAGFAISYRSRAEPAGKAPRRGREEKAMQEEKQEVTQAVLGGGDVAFPLLFAGVAMETLITVHQYTKELAFLKALVIPAAATAVLIGLLLLGKRGRFYPAMPFLTAGCFAGLALLSIGL
jgi:presenilin-like A22 family membrane protease